MKKLCFIFAFFVLCGISVFGNNDGREEVDYLLFMPNSGSRFVDEDQAFIQLNNLAQYLSNKNLSPGQIIVCGYAAYVPNNINSADLSRERALFVMEELQKRGVSKDLFSDPVGYGSVYLWGNNTDENDRKLNRRARVFLTGESPISIIQEIIAVETEAPEAEAGKIFKEETIAPVYRQKYPPGRTTFKIPLWVFPVLPMLAVLAMLAAAIIYLLLNNSSRKPVHKNKTAKVVPPVSKIDIVPAFVPLSEPAVESDPEFSPEEAVTTWMVNLEEEIRLRAYDLSQQRGGSGDYRDQDWYNAVREISALYKARGYSVFIDKGCWWASRSYSYDFPATDVN